MLWSICNRASGTSETPSRWACLLLACLEGMHLLQHASRHGTASNVTWGRRCTISMCFLTLTIPSPEVSQYKCKRTSFHVLQELQEKLDLQHRDRKRAIAKLNRVRNPLHSITPMLCCIASQHIRMYHVTFRTVMAVLFLDCSAEGKYVHTQPAS